MDKNKNDVRLNLLQVCDEVYTQLHKKISDMFSGTENINIARIHEFRRFYAHGTFLDEDVFEKVLLGTRARMPKEIVYVPYCLILALSSNPDRFFEYIQSKVDVYDHKLYKPEK